MLLFLGDLHLGRGSPDESRRAERDAVDLLEAHHDALLDPAGGLILLGDVFNAFLEYDSLIPAGFLRLQGALARLVDRGVEVTYVVGNRDPWHLTYFEREVGLQLVTESLSREAYGRRLFVAHGDRFGRSERAFQLLRPLFRNPVAYWLYRHLPPGDTAFRLARWLAGRGSGAPTPDLIEDLRSAARAILAEQNVDLVVMGHSHHAELLDLSHGTYLNTGYWFADRTYGVLDDQGPRLLKWAPGT
jgi:UDP-2,3-diacylglucosamine hydrolase